MTRSRSLIVLALLLPCAACTVLSGVEGMELRSGSRPAPGPVDASGVDAADVPDDSAVLPPDAGVDATTDGACATPQACQDERCKTHVLDSRINDQVGTSLGVTATCTAGPPFLIAPGPSHYYGADVRCTLAPQPTASAVASFKTQMEADGWYGWSTKYEGADLVVIGQSTTQLCNTY